MVLPECGAWQLSALSGWVLSRVGRCSHGCLVQGACRGGTGWEIHEMLMLPPGNGSARSGPTVGFRRGGVHGCLAVVLSACAPMS